MQLNKLLQALSLNEPVNASYDIEIKDICCDSRLVKKDCLFVAIEGTNQKGSAFIDEALRRGASCIITEETGIYGAVKNGVPVIRHKNTHDALSILADTFFGHPSGSINVVGVTGTNGKTTTTYLIDSILREAGHSSGIIGTIVYKIKDKIINASNTTPGPLMLESLLREMVDGSCGYCLMEVSSHGLDQGRTKKIDFKSAIFTNLTQDHLDYHKTIENYFLAKSRLFSELSKDANAIINLDSPFALRLKNMTSAKVLTYGIDTNSDVRASSLCLGIRGSTFVLLTDDFNVQLETSIIGKHNISNILCAIAFALSEDIELEYIKRGIEKFKGVKGRLERLESEGRDIFIDYAHTPDALESVLRILKSFSGGNLTLVFGCGGERDRLKRPLMGEIAGKYADRIIITSDNPRSEKPQDIACEIATGIKNKEHEIILDRKDAIFSALKNSENGEIILIAGKGHEDYQIFRDKKIEFDDYKVAKECLRNLKLG